MKSIGKLLTHNYSSVKTVRKSEFQDSLKLMNYFIQTQLSRNTALKDVRLESRFVRAHLLIYSLETPHESLIFL